MYICPTCRKQFNTEDEIAKHFLGCWKSHNPNHKSKSAPRGEDKTERNINEGILNFFEALQNEVNYARSKD